MQALCAAMAGLTLALVPVMLNVQGKLDSKVLTRIMKF